MSEDSLTLARIAEVLADVSKDGAEDPVTFDVNNGASDPGLMGLEDQIRRVIACHVEASLRILLETTDPEYGMQVYLGDADLKLVVAFPEAGRAAGSDPVRRIDLRQLLRDDIADNTDDLGHEEDRQWTRERYQRLADLFEELAAMAREEANR